eukprot:2084767-Rhodomonas_salina.3
MTRSYLKFLVGHPSGGGRRERRADELKRSRSSGGGPAGEEKEGRGGWQGHEVQAEEQEEVRVAVEMERRST